MRLLVVLRFFVAFCGLLCIIVGHYASLLFIVSHSGTCWLIVFHVPHFSSLRFIVASFGLFVANCGSLLLAVAN